MGSWEYYSDNGASVFPQNSQGSPFNAASIAVDDPDVNEVIKFLRQREVVHFQRFGEAILTYSNRFGGYIACVKMQFIDIENYKFLLEILLLINV